MANFANPSFETNVAGWIAGKKPTDIANNIFWGDASQESYGNGDYVGTITDRSGAGNNLNTIGPSGGTPKYTTNGLNGSAVYTFGGGTSIKSSGTFAWNQQSFSYVVGKVPSGGGQYMYSVLDGVNTRVFYIDPNNNRAAGYAGGNLFGTATWTDFNIFFMDWNGASAYQYVNGTAFTANVGANNGGGLIIGENGGAGGDSMNGTVVEAGIITGAVGTADRKDLNSYLAFKYALPMSEGGTAVRVTNTGYTGSASLKIVAIDNDTPFYEMVNPGNTNNFTLSCYTYIDGSTVTDNTYASLYYNGTAQTTTYADQGSGWTKLSCSITGANQSRKCGVVIKTTKTVYADVFDLTEQASGAPKGYRNAPLMGVG